MASSSAHMSSTSEMRGHVAQHVAALGQHAGGHELQCRVLGAPDRQFPRERAGGTHEQAGHASSMSVGGHRYGHAVPRGAGRIRVEVEQGETDATAPQPLPRRRRGARPPVRPTRRRPGGRGGRTTRRPADRADRRRRPLPRVLPHRRLVGRSRDPRPAEGRPGDRVPARGALLGAAVRCAGAQGAARRHRPGGAAVVVDPGPPLPRPGDDGGVDGHVQPGRRAALRAAHPGADLRLGRPGRRVRRTADRAAVGGARRRGDHHGRDGRGGPTGPTTRGDRIVHPGGGADRRRRRRADLVGVRGAAVPGAQPGDRRTVVRRHDLDRGAPTRIQSDGDRVWGRWPTGSVPA